MVAVVVVVEVVVVILPCTAEIRNARRNNVLEHGYPVKPFASGRAALALGRPAISISIL